MKLFILAIIALMVSGIAVAAEVPTSEGDMAMVFMFNGFDHLGLGAYGGEYGVGMRYYIADDTAIRGGVHFGMETVTRECEDEDDEEFTKSIYGVSAVYEKHLEGPCASVSPYWGAGAGFWMSSSEYTNWWTMEGYDEWGYETWSLVDGVTYKGNKLGVFGVLGFEWAFTSCMTLGGEYQAGFWSETWEVEVDEDSETRDMDYDKVSNTVMGFGTASVYLSVYF